MSDGGPTDDLSALAWVHEELRRSLEAAHKALRRFVRDREAASGSDIDAVDPAVLRTARAQIHQGVGALELVGQPAAALVLSASEALVQRFVARPNKLTGAVVDDLERASFALLDYLGRLLAGKSISPLALFPRYRAVLEAAGSERVHPADLWHVDWQWRALPSEPSATPRRPDAESQSVFEAQLLALMRAPDPRAAAGRLRDLCAGLAAGATTMPAATLWQLAAAMFEAQAQGLLGFDVFNKRVTSRLLAQFRAFAKGDEEVPERLAQDLLFFCAQSTVPADPSTAPRLAAVRAAYRLERQAPVDYMSTGLGRFDPALIAQAKKRVVAAKDAWSGVAGGELHRLTGLSEQFALVGDSLKRLFPHGDVFAGELQQAIAQTQQAGAVPPPTLAMEVATSLLYIEAALDDIDFDHPAQTGRVARLAERLAGVRAGRPPEPLEDWMEELYRRVSDRQTMGSVVQELRASLAEAEKAIDAYFRDPARRDLLIPVPQQLASMRGVLSVLGMDPAAAVLLRMRDEVDALSSTQVDAGHSADTGVFDRLAGNLGALGFLIDMLGVQPQMAKALFTYDAESGVLRPVMGRADDAKAEAAPSRVGALEGGIAEEGAVDPALIEQAQWLAFSSVRDDVPDAEVARDLGRLTEDARAADQSELAVTAEKAKEALEQAGESSADTAAVRGALSEALVDFVVSTSQPIGLDLEMPDAVPAEAAAVGDLASAPGDRTAALPSSAAAPDLALDDEMREVFLEEAREVLAQATEALAGLAAASDDLALLTTLRRAFHTLKGSSRMVGLKEFGEGAWVCEQLYNTQLAEQGAAAPALLDFTRWSLDEFGGWVEEIAAGAPITHTAATIAEAARLVGGTADEPVLESAVAPLAAESTHAPLASVLPFDLPSAADLDLSGDRTLAAEPPPAEPAGTTADLEFDFGAAGPAETPLPPLVLELPPFELDLGALDSALHPLDAELPLLESGSNSLEVAASLSLEIEAIASDRLAPSPSAPVDAAAEALLDPFDSAPTEPLPLPEAVEVAWNDAPSLEPIDLELDFDIDVPPAVGSAEAPSASISLVPPHSAPVPDSIEAAFATPYPVLGDDDAGRMSPEASVDAAEPALAGPAAAPVAPDDFISAGDAGSPTEPVGAVLSDWVTAPEPLNEATTAAAAPAVEAALVDDAVASAADIAAAPADASGGDDDEQVRIVGPLRIGSALFNIYLGEADELSRRLVTDVAEWSYELHRPVGETAIALAHSLAGNSATVGFVELSQLARTLEHALTRSQALGHGTPDEGQLFVDVADEIRGLLHQFAAGFLKSPAPELVERLAEHGRSTAGRLDAAAVDDEAFAEAFADHDEPGAADHGAPGQDAEPEADSETADAVAMTAPGAEAPAPIVSTSDEASSEGVRVYEAPFGAAPSSEFSEAFESREAIEAVAGPEAPVAPVAIFGAPPVESSLAPVDATADSVDPVDTADTADETEVVVTTDAANANDAMDVTEAAEAAETIEVAEVAEATEATEAIQTTETTEATETTDAVDATAATPTAEATTPTAMPAAPAADAHYEVLGVAALRPLADLPADAPRVRASAAPEDADDHLDAQDAVDPELFEFFAEEADELLPQLATRLREWARRPADAALPAACMRTLHTLKGGARLAGGMRLGELAHRLETRIERLAASETVAGADVEALLVDSDRLAQTFQVLRDGGEASAAAADAAPLPASYTNAASAMPSAPAASVLPEKTPVSPAADAADPADFVPAAADAQVVPAQSAASETSEETSDAMPEAPVDAFAPGLGLSMPERDAIGAENAASASATPTPVPADGAIDWSRFTSAGAGPRKAAERAPSVQSAVRVRAPLLDRLVNQAGEVSISRSRIEAGVGQIKTSLGDLTENLERLRAQLRDIEFHGETQMSSRLEAAKAASQAFDPLEFDRFTRFQELTRMMAESVNDVATVQRSLQRSLEVAEDELAAQARMTRELQDELLRTRMVEFEGLSDRLYRVVRQAAKETGKSVRLDIVGGGVEVDRGVLDRMTGAFEHLLRNAVVHGIEAAEVRQAAGKDSTGSIVVALTHDGNEVGVEFRDDGAGLDFVRIREKATRLGLIGADRTLADTELANLIFEPGFTTAEAVTELAGRGVGMDVVRSDVNAMGGRIETASSSGQGASFKLILPLTTAVTQVVMLRCGETTVALPSTLVEAVRRANPADIDAAYASGSYMVGDRALQFFWLGALLQTSPRSTEHEARTRAVVIVRSAQQRIAVHVDEVLGNREVVVKNLGPQLSRLPGLAGVSLLASGNVALIYNPVALAALYGDAAREATHSASRALRGGPDAAATGPGGALGTGGAEGEGPLVMVVDDSLTVRRVTQRLLRREGYRVLLAKDGLDALEQLATARPEVVLSDIEMPRMDGFDLVRNLRAQPRLRDLPVIMITSRIAQKHRDYAAELGVDHYLGKPYSEEDLLALIARYTADRVAVH